MPEFIRGKTTKESNALIIEELKRRGVLLAEEPIAPQLRVLADEVFASDHEVGDEIGCQHPSY